MGQEFDPFYDLVQRVEQLEREVNELKQGVDVALGCAGVSLEDVANWRDLLFRKSE